MSMNVEQVRESGGSGVRVPKMAELVAQNVRRRIVRGELLEGTRLPAESDLMQEYGVSRPTLREAIRVLEAEQLISVRRGSREGAIVRAPTAVGAATLAGLVLERRGTTFSDVYEARTAFESGVAGFAAKRRTPDDVERLRRAVKEESEADDPMKVAALQVTFHELLAEISRNETAKLVVELLQRVVGEANRLQVNRLAGSEGQVDAARLGTSAHRRVISFIEAGDVEGAQECWQKHLRESAAYVLDAVGTDTLIDLFSGPDLGWASSQD
jgi:DNA-binding FadR family transcriptional regulator